MGLRRILRSALGALARRHPSLIKYFVRFYRPRGDEYAELLKRRAGLHSIGKGCHINYSVAFTDPQWVSIGHNETIVDPPF